MTGRTRLASPEPGFVSQAGSWGSRLSARDDGDGRPRAVAGTHGGTGRSAGGTEVVFVGAHAGATGPF